MKNISRIMLSSLLACSVVSVSYTAEPTPSRFSWTSFKGECPVKGLSVKGTLKRAWPYIGLFAFLHFINQNSAAAPKISPAPVSAKPDTTNSSAASTTPATTSKDQPIAEKLCETTFSKAQAEMLKIITAVFFTDLIKQDIKDLQAIIADLYDRYCPTLAIV
jgi:hypothetical protein